MLLVLAHRGLDVLEAVNEQVSFLSLLHFTSGLSPGRRGIETILVERNLAVPPVLLVSHFGLMRACLDEHVLIQRL